MKEKLLLQFTLSNLQHLSFIDTICNVCYKKTGCKFQVMFNGSKGYLSNIQIECEGHQKANNRLFVEMLRGIDENQLLNIFWSPQNGVRLSTGADTPQTIMKERKNPIQPTCAEAGNDLPF